MYCPKCGRDTNVVEGQEYCGHCGEKFPPVLNDRPIMGHPSYQPSTISLPVAPEQETTEDEQYSSPWEDENSTGFFPGLILTLKQTMFTPAHYFEKMPRSGNWLLPVLFYLIMGVIGATLGLVSGFFVESPVMTHGALVKHMAISSILALPLLLFVELYFGALIIHLSMIIFGARRESFHATLKILAYSAGPNIFYVVPFVGWLIVATWSFWITLTGVRVVGGVSTGRALLVTVAPAFLVLAILFGILFLVVGLIGVSGLL